MNKIKNNILSLCSCSAFSPVHVHVLVRLRICAFAPFSVNPEIFTVIIKFTPKNRLKRFLTIKYQDLKPISFPGSVPNASSVQIMALFFCFSSCILFLPLRPSIAPSIFVCSCRCTNYCSFSRFCCLSGYYFYSCFCSRSSFLRLSCFSFSQLCFWPCFVLCECFLLLFLPPLLNLILFQLMLLLLFPFCIWSCSCCCI